MKKPITVCADRPRTSRRSLRTRRRARHLRQHLCERDRRLGPEDRQDRRLRRGRRRTERLHARQRRLRLFDPDAQRRQLGRADPSPALDPEDAALRRDVEILVAEADGVKFDGPNDLAFGPDGRLYFTDSGDWAPDDETASRTHRRRRDDRRGAHSRRTRPRLSQRHRRRTRRVGRVGRILYAERRAAKARRREAGHPSDARGAYSRRAQDRRRRQSLDHRGRRRRRRRHRPERQAAAISWRRAAPSSIARSARAARSTAATWGRSTSRAPR